MSESISALKFIHCVRLKGFFTFEHLFAISVCSRSPVWDITQNYKVLPPEENYCSLTLSHLVVKLPHSLDHQQEPQNEHMNPSYHLWHLLSYFRIWMTWIHEFRAYMLPPEVCYLFWQQRFGFLFWYQRFGVNPSIHPHSKCFQKLLHYITICAALLLH